MAALFEFERVSLVRGTTRILDEVTVTIPDAGITGLIGASGSGKSTMLRCCNRLERPTSGTIHFRGVDLATLDPLAHRRRVAMVFQQPTVFAGTGLDNLLAADPDLDVTAGEELLSRVGLPADLLHRQADILSGGEAQRLCLARALATRPEVVLADEPTSALDQRSAELLEADAQREAADGLPIIWVSHDLDQVARVADQVVEIDRGHISFSGSVAEHVSRARDVR